MSAKEAAPFPLPTYIHIPHLLLRYHFAHLSLLTSYRPDTSARQEPHQPPPPYQLPAPVRWQVLDMAPDSRGQNFSYKPDPGDQGGVSWNVGNGDAHETESGTSHITLHQPDTLMLVSLPTNIRKRTGSDSSPTACPAATSPYNISREDQSPKRSRPRPTPSPKRTMGPGGDSLTSGT